MPPDNPHHVREQERPPDTAAYPAEKIPALRTPTQYKIAMIVKRILLDESEWIRIVPAIERMVVSLQGRDAARRVMTILRIWYDTELTPLRAKISEGELSVREFGSAVEALVRRFEATVQCEEKEKVIANIREKIDATKDGLNRTVGILRDIDRGTTYNPEMHNFQQYTWMQLASLYDMAHREYEDTILPLQQAVSDMLRGGRSSPTLHEVPATPLDTAPETNLFTAADIAAEIEELTKTALINGGMSSDGASHAICLFLLEHLGNTFTLWEIRAGIEAEHPGRHTDGNIQQSASSIIKKPNRSERKTFRIIRQNSTDGRSRYAMHPKEKSTTRTPQEE